MSIRVYLEDLFALNRQHALPNTSAQTSTSQTSTSSSINDDNLTVTNQIAKIMTDVRQELGRTNQSTSEKYRFRPDQLAQMLEVFRLAIQENANLVTDQEREEMETFTLRSMTRYISESHQFVIQYGSAVKKNEETLQQRDEAIKNLEIRIEDSSSNQRLDVSAEVKKLSSIAIDKIQQANEARVLFLRAENESEEFSSALKVLKTRVLSHPWYHGKAFQAIFKAIKLIENDEAESGNRIDPSSQTPARNPDADLFDYVSNKLLMSSPRKFPEQQ